MIILGVVSVLILGTLGVVLCLFPKPTAREQAEDDEAQVEFFKECREKHIQATAEHHRLHIIRGR